MKNITKIGVIRSDIVKSALDKRRFLNLKVDIQKTMLRRSKSEMNFLKMTNVPSSNTDRMKRLKMKVARPG